jgi:D-3-phosphoglycerate dehydrogenase
MFKLWFDEALLPSCAHLLDGVAEGLGPSAHLAGIEQAHAFICPGNTKYDGARMDLAPNLRVIARLGVGYDNIDVPAATARSIPVVYAPDAPTVSTAEHTWALLMAVAKKVTAADRVIRHPGWSTFWSTHDTKGMELEGQTLGLVGVGRIGSRVARAGLGFGMKVLAYDPFVTPERAAEMGVALAPSLEALLRASDVVSLHVPSNAETFKFMNAQRFAQMKPGALLINAARGALVDESALIDALRSGHLGGAGLDVYHGEPIAPDNPLLHVENVVATPHIASRTVAGNHRIWETTVRQALQVLRGEKPPHLLNPEVWERRRR